MKTFWQDQSDPHILGNFSTPKNSSILVVGSGLAGTSAGLFLLKQQFKDFSIVDCGTENASYFRNAGHILHGAGENYRAMTAIHGRDKTKSIFNLSLQFCQQIKQTIEDLKINCDYDQGKYFVVAENNSSEADDIIQSVKMMSQDRVGDCVMEENPQKWGFKSGIAKRCNISAQANPSKFRNQLLKFVLSNGINYYHCPIEKVQENAYGVEVFYKNKTSSKHDAIILTTNAYVSLISNFFEQKRLVEPFKGQIIVSKPMEKKYTQMLFSMDHGYVYGTITKDNRLLIGGWRNNIPGGEVGTYSLEINPITEDGLKKFVEQKFNFEKLQWEYSWAGIMGSSNTGLPLLGPINNSTIYTLTGCTGYGFGWFHGCAKVLVDIVLGNKIPEQAYLLSIPKV